MNRKEAGLEGDNYGKLLNLLRKLAQSLSQESYRANLEELQKSSIWKENTKVRDYLNKQWLPVVHRWVKALRDPEFEAEINTNNGVESLNRLLKYNFLPHAPDKTLTAIVTIIIKDFLADQYSNYRRNNFKSTLKSFNTSIPVYLHGRPKSFIAHCRSRIESAQIEVRNGNSFLVSSNHALRKYVVKMSDSDVSHVVTLNPPECDCLDFKHHRKVCKHFFTLIEGEVFSWNDIPSSLRDRPDTVLDTDITSKAGSENTSNPSQSPPLETANDIENATDFQFIKSLPVKSGNNLKAERKKIISLMETLRNNVYDCHDLDTLKNVRTTLDTVNEELKSHIPTDQGLPVSSSPRRQYIMKRKSRKTKIKSSGIKPLLLHGQVRKKKQEHWKSRNRVGKKAEIYRSQYKVPLPIPNRDTNVDLLRKYEVLGSNLPAWGGQVIDTSTGNIITLTNTCPIDNLLAFLYLQDLISPSIISEQHGQKGSELANVIKLTKEKKFTDAKIAISKWCQLQPSDGCLNYYGNEDQLFLIPNKYLYMSKSNSTCSSSFCPQPTCILISNEHQIPQLPLDTDKDLTKSNIEKALAEWIINDSDIPTKCGRKFHGHVPPEADTEQEIKIDNATGQR